MGRPLAVVLGLLTIFGPISMDLYLPAMHLRELFIEHGLLEPIDRNLLHFEAWLDRILTELTDPDHRHLIKEFATWHHLRRSATSPQAEN